MSGGKSKAAKSRARTAHLVHAFASPAALQRHGVMTIARGKGVYVWDAEGRKYLDGLASLWNVAVGHGRGEIARAVAAQMRQLEYAPTLLGFSSEPAEQLATRIARLGTEGPDPGRLHLRRLRGQRDGDPPGATVLAPARSVRTKSRSWRSTAPTTAPPPARRA